MKYDYSKNILLEVKDYEKISQVEKRMQENKTKEGEENNNNNQENINLNQNFAINKNQNLNNIIVRPEATIENPLIKEIEYSLKKQESQESIYLLNKISLFVFIILIGIEALTLYYILYASNKVNKIGNLVTNSYRLYILNSVGIYYVKELI